MTEEEAKTKWCPFARVGVAANPEIPPANRDVDMSVQPFGPKLFPAAFCIGSACMAWRRDVQRLHRPHSAEIELKRLGYEWRLDPIDPNYIINDWNGFCGLAGKP